MFKSLDNIEKYLDKEMNVLLIGKHGIGKTSIVQKLFTSRFKDRWKYFSAAVMDPFLDFVGVPEKITDDKGVSYLELVRPKEFQDDNVEAIFMDEYNRAPKKILAATMELIQFKSINGRKFNNLKVVWAAINPDDLKEYDVEKLDPAIQDRFQIQIEMPYLLDKDYFTNKFGQEVAGSAIEWWSELDAKAKDSVSPRRLEYALQVYDIKGDLKDVLPKNCNIGKLLENLKLGSVGSRVEKLLAEQDENVIKSTLDGNMKIFIQKNLSNPKYIEKFTPFLGEELLLQEAPNNFEMCSFINENRGKFDLSTLATLEKLDCFKESAFKDTFINMQKLLPDGKYVAQRRNKMRKVLAKLPDISSIKVRKGDIANLQKLLNITSDYISVSTNTTIDKDDKIFNFIEKFANLSELNTATGLGLDFQSNSMFPLFNKIAQFNYAKQPAQPYSNGGPIGNAGPVGPAGVSGQLQSIADVMANQSINVMANPITSFTPTPHSITG